MIVYFPEEVLVEILKRLPIEALVRFITVCKSWYSLITSPSFISLNSKHIASSIKGSLLIRDYYPEHSHEEYFSVLNLDDGKLKILDCPVNKRKEKSLDFPLVEPNLFFRVVGCVNGVVCLSDDLDWARPSEDIILWNPSIRKYVTLPQPLFGFTTHDGYTHSVGFIHSVGFGFDATTKDFKVVRVVYLDDDRWEGITVPKVEVYELRVGSWRSVDAKEFSYTIDKCSPQAFLHGTVHWVIGSDNKFKVLDITCLIVTFDLATEEFGVMKVPEILAEKPLQRDFCLSVLGDSLALIRDTWSDRRDDGNGCCVWVMQQYGLPDSWTKLFNVDVTGCYWRVCGFQSTGEAIVMAGGYNYPIHHKLVSFEPQRQQVSYICDFGDWAAFYVDNFKARLALLGVKGESLVKSKSADEAIAVAKRSPDKDLRELEDENRSADQPRTQNLIEFLGQVHTSLFLEWVVAAYDDQSPD